MAESFDAAPDASGGLSLKGQLTGVSVVSRKAKIAAVVVVFAVLGFILLATVSGWERAAEGPEATVSKGQGTDKPGKIETADLSHLGAGVSDGQASAGVPVLAQAPAADVKGAVALPAGPGVGTAIPKAAAGAAAAGKPPLKVPTADALPATGGPGPVNSAESEAGIEAERRRTRAQVLESAKSTGVDVPWGSGGDRPGDGGRQGTDDLRRQLAAAAKTGPGLSLEVAAALSAAQRALGQQQGVPDDQNKQLRKEQFLASAAAQADKGYLQEIKRDPIGRCEIKAGWVIPAALGCGTNSDLPGQVCGRVRENVYDHRTGKHILIPQGTAIVGTYDSHVAIGQQRILVVWNRLIYEDGTSLALQAMPGGDQAGMAGFDADVDNHFGRIATTAAIMSIFSAGFQLSQSSNGSNNSTTNPTVGQAIANSVGQQIGQIGTAAAQREMNVQPTLSRGPGYRFNVMVTKDIVLPCSKHG